MVSPQCLLLCNNHKVISHSILLSFFKFQLLSSIMSRTAVQFQLTAPKGQFTQVAVPRPIPGPNEICIRTKAVALNPLDAKQYAHGMLVQSWPAVLGVDASGIVESVGESVQDLQPGDGVSGSVAWGIDLLHSKRSLPLTLGIWRRSRRDLVLKRPQHSRMSPQYTSKYVSLTCSASAISPPQLL